MAPKAGQATGTATAAQRRTAISAVRGVSLALHAASGLTMGLDLESTRLLRVCEGLVRAAVGRLEALGRAAPSAGSAGGVVPKELVVDDNKELLNELGKGKKKKQKAKKKGKNKGKGMEVDQGDLVTAAASLSAVAPASVPGLELEDRWADSAPTIHGPPPEPELQQAAAGDAPERPPRALVPRRSGSRTPRRDDEPRDSPQQPPEPSCAQAPLVVGHIAVLKSLTSRPELSGVSVLISEWDGLTGRWVCLSPDETRLRVKPESLQSIAPEQQSSALLQHEAAALHGASWL